MTAAAPFWAMRPAAAALEEAAAGALLAALVGAVRVAELAREVGALVALTLRLTVELVTGAEVLEAVASVEVLARVNGMELGGPAVPVGVIPAIENNEMNTRKI